MKRFPLHRSVGLLFFFSLMTLTGVLYLKAETRNPTSVVADQIYQEGNYKEAYSIYEQLCLQPGTSPEDVVHAFNKSLDCQEQLGNLHLIDSFWERVAELHAQQWQVLQAVADSYLEQDHYGFIVEGKFFRGDRRNSTGANYAEATERDRVRALQLYLQALPLVKAATAEQQGRFFLSFAEAVMFTSEDEHQSWQLQVKTDLTTLPPYDEQATQWGWGRGSSSVPGAPVDEQGNPVYYQRADSWEQAANDGERWRWLLEQARQADPELLSEVLGKWAGFLHQNFGVQTMRDAIGPLLVPATAAEQAGEETELNEQTGPFAVTTLAETETIAQLANGVKRFSLPDEFNFIKVYQQILHQPNKYEYYKHNAYEKLVSIFENRQQYPRAAEYLRASLKKFPEDLHQDRAKKLSQIVDPWGQFEGNRVQAAGDGAELAFLFRNGKELELEAFRINYPQLLADVKTYIKSDPQQFDWQKIQIEQVGHRLVWENEKKYLGEKVADWKLKLEPRPNHFDRRISIKTPLTEAGAYLLTAKMKDGNTSRIIVWLDDTAIINKSLDQKEWYYVADAKTGAPISGARIEFFGYRTDRPIAKKLVTTVSEFVDQTNAAGQVTVGRQRADENFNWLVTATTPGGRLAFTGFQGLWLPHYQQQEYRQNKVYIVTDRPVYRPGQKVQFKLWVRHASYEDNHRAAFANQEFQVEINDPRNIKLLDQKFKTDEHGAFHGEIELPAETTLGVYQIVLPWNNGVGGSLAFRVEEYKKPEFEVTVDAPAEPIPLGEKLTATIRAKYYFGAPVTNAKVTYKVERTSHDTRWYPVDRWDWLYGKGSWWFASNYDWYPGFERWGCIAPDPFWWDHHSDPPELVLENTVPVGPDGTVTIEIDTALAKAVHGDSDHEYKITAEVVDQSRRTIVGAGSVLAAREPFRIHVWPDRGYYQAGDTITIQAKALTIDQKPIVGPGELSLFAISYNAAGEPAEKLLDSWQLETNEQGEIAQKMKAATAGQYRVAFRMTDKNGNQQEGAYIFLVRGEDSTLVDYRFNDLELILDRKTYQPGEKAQLLINTKQPNSTVLLFLRPINGVYLAPQLIKLEGKSTVVEIDVEGRDMPNFFVEAMTLADAVVYQEARSVAVPPEKRIINVELLPNSEKYLPGQEAEVTIRLTDDEGNPVTGSTVLTVYDRSLEYISGGSNIGDIQEFFWKFRRNHHPRYESSLQRYFYQLFKENEIAMQTLGVFGDLVADAEIVDGKEFAVGAAVGLGGGGMMQKRGLAGAMMVESSALPMAAMSADKAEFRDEVAKAADDVLFQPEVTYVEPTVRKNFVDLAYWNATITPDATGKAIVKFPMPENLSSWKMKVWSIGEGTKVGEAETTAVTAKDVLVRLQAPRFFVQKDELILSANVHNYLKIAKQAQVELILEGATLTGLDQARRTVEIAADGELRVDWKVHAIAEGEATITVKVLTDTDSDAMQMTFPVYVHGMLKTESFTGVLRSNDEQGEFKLTVPAERRPEQTRLEIRYSPTLAGAMVDALPYLLDYPYGCTEQTLNRFLPAVITQNVLQRMGLDLADLAKRQNNLNAQEIGDPADRAIQWKKTKANPVFDTAEMEEIVKTGLKRLADMQLKDGGWGWFSGRGEQSYPHTTATVVHGLQIATENGLLLNAGMLEQGISWLEKYQQEQVKLLKKGEAKKPKQPYRKTANDLDALVYMILVDAGINQQPMQDYLYRDRTQLSVYSLAMCGLALHRLDQAERLDMIMRNIEQYYVEDLENETAYLQIPAGYSWWYWHGNEIEANAYYLKLLAKTEPRGVRAPRLVKYLLNNRKHASYWNSTRDTALCIEAMAEYMQASGEDRPDLNLTILIDGQARKTVQINPENLFHFDAALVLADEQLTTGEHSIEFRKQGSGPLYWNAYLTNFTLEDPITATGLELKIRRKVYRLVRQENATAQVAGARGQVLDQQAEKYDRIELQTGDAVQSGDLLEIELGIDSKNDYEYILLEDFKAAGNEPVDLRSGYLEDANGAYVEFRDEKVAFFMRALPRGTSSMSYRLRAEIPGTFAALPAVSYGMYAPELIANSDEFQLIITDRTDLTEENK